MKRILLILLSLILLSSVFITLTVSAAESNLQDWNWKIYINNTPIDTKTLPDSGVTFVPLRKVFETLDCTVDYTQTEQGGYIAIQKGITTVSLQENNPYITVNDMVDGVYSNFIDQDKHNIVPQRDQFNSLYIPVRAVAEALFCKVDADLTTQTITITPHYDVTPCKNERFSIVNRTKNEINDVFVCDRSKKARVPIDIAGITDIKDIFLEKNSFPVAFNAITKSTSTETINGIEISQDVSINNFYLININEKEEVVVDSKGNDVNLLTLFNDNNTVLGKQWVTDGEDLNIQLSDALTIKYNIKNNSYTTNSGYIVNSYQNGKNEEGTPQITLDMQYIIEERGGI